MILTYGDVSLLAGKPWFVLELRSERTSEEILKRIGKEAPKIFQDDPLEMFIPVTTRDLDVFQLSTENYIFVRSTDPHKIAKLRHITGVVQILCEGDTQKVSKFIPVDNDYVQGLIDEAEKRHMSGPATLRCGSFVRILDGHTRDFCGEVMSIGTTYACVKIDLKTKIILVETPLTNLKDISHVPANCRVFYWSDPVSEFLHHCGDQAVEALSQDLKFEETKGVLGAVPLPPVGAVEEVVTTGHLAHTRQFTITAEIRRALKNGIVHPLDLVKITAERVRRGELKPTANLTIFWHTIRSMVFKHLKDTQPALNLQGYKQVRELWPDYAVPMSVIKALLPGIPVKTPKGKWEKPVKKAAAKASSRQVRVTKVTSSEVKKPELAPKGVTPPLPEPPVAVASTHDFIVPDAPVKKRRARRKQRPSFTTLLRTYLVARGSISIADLIAEGDRICRQENIKVPLTAITFSKAIKALVMDYLAPLYPKITCYTHVVDILGPDLKLTAKQVEEMTNLYQKVPADVDPGTVYGFPVSDLVPASASKATKAKKGAPREDKKSVSSSQEPSPTFIEAREASEVVITPTPSKHVITTYETDIHAPLVIHCPSSPLQRP